MSSSKPFVSVISVIEQDTAVELDLLEAEILAVKTLLDPLVRESDFVLIANGIEEGSLADLRSMLSRLEDVQVYVLARAVDPDVAILAGVENALGDLVLTLDLGHYDPEVLPDMIEAAGSHDAVLLDTCGTTGGLHGWLRRGFYRGYAGLTGVDESSICSQRLMSRRLVSYILQHDEAPSLLRRLAIQSGFPIARLSSRRNITPRRRSLRRELAKALRLLTCGTTAPLRAVSGVAILAGGLNLAYMAYVLAIHLLKDDVAPGWVTLSFQISGGFLFMSLMLALVAEYILQIHGRAVRQPAYYIAQEFRSNVMTRESRLNVLRQA